MQTDQAGGPPLHIVLIRHGEKPADPTDEGNVDPDCPGGVDVDGAANPHSLTPRGWQRSGALAVLFTRPPRPGAVALPVPDQLLVPDYGSTAKTAQHRTYQTLLGLSGVTGHPIDSPLPLGDEAALALSVLGASAGTVLICWEHKNIPAIVEKITVDAATPAPTTWPDDRFDLIWQLTLITTTPPTYSFAALPQAVLRGDER